jgi:formiminoglutamate deiminase
VRITVSDGMITRVEPDSRPEPGEELGGVALPGMPNVHSHAFQRGMAGLSERRSGRDDSFWSWREVMYRFLDRMSPDDVEAVSAQAFAEMLEGGFTRVGEFHYLHHDPDGRAYDDPAELAGRVAAAVETSGIRLTLLPCFYAHGDFGATAPSSGQRRFINDLDGFAALFARCETIVASLEGATIGVAPHSLRAVSPDELRFVAGLAGERPVHIHAAEQRREVEACVAWSGRRPVQWLLDEAELDARWCLIHATHVTDDEISRLARSGAAVGLCPVTEASLGDGTFPAEAWLAAGGAFGIGTDSNVLIGVAEELRQLECSQRLATGRRNVLADGDAASTGARLHSAALATGARVLGAPPPRLAAGSPADIVALSPDAACLAADEPETLLDGWIFAGDRSCVRDVWCAGRRVVAEGRHVQADAILARYRRTVRTLADRC